MASRYRNLQELKLTSLNDVTPDGICMLAACQQLRALSLGGSTLAGAPFSNLLSVAAAPHLCARPDTGQAYDSPSLYMLQ